LGDRERNILTITSGVDPFPRVEGLASISHGWFERGLPEGHGNVLLSRDFLKVTGTSS